VKVGTFLQYFIVDNRQRVFADDLLLNFSTLDLSRKSNIDYIIMDTNTGTIDTSPGETLKKRYENAMVRLRDEGATLVETDNICTWIAFHHPAITDEEFRLFTTTQFNSRVNGVFQPA